MKANKSLPKTSKLKLCSISPTPFEALIVYLPKWADETFGTTKNVDDVLASVSNLILSLTVNSFPFNDQVNLAFGRESTRHSNRACWSWIAIVSLGIVTNFGAPI